MQTVAGSIFLSGKQSFVGMNQSVPTAQVRLLGLFVRIPNKSSNCCVLNITNITKVTLAPYSNKLIYIFLNIILDCDVLSNPANGAVDITTGTTYGEQATYSCNVGYNLVGNAQTLCMADGNWETTPTCQIVSKYNY